VFRRLVFFFLLLSGPGAMAQQGGIPHIDSVTYNLYMNGSWKELKEEGHKAIKQHQDFYYLYFRTGVAYFELKKYRVAQKYLQKAYGYNRYDDHLNYWLYYTLFANEKYDEAFRLSKKFADTTARYFGIKKPSGLNMIDVYGGKKIPNTTQYFGNTLLAGAGFNHRVGKGISFYHCFSYLQEHFTIADMRQEQYFLQANIPLTNTFALKPAASIVYLDVKSTDSLLPDFNKYYYLGSLTAVKSFPFFDISLVPSVSDFSNPNQSQTQLQLAGGFTLYPFYNNWFKISYQHIAQQTNPSTSIHTADYIVASVKPFSRLEIKGTYYTGNIKFANELNGYVVNNSPDLLKNRFSAQAELQLCTHLVVYGYYNMEKRNGLYFDFNTLNPEQLNYSYQTLVTGLKIIL
jgi:tetratricopeptide (TPR) repeat protein